MQRIHLLQSVYQDLKCILIHFLPQYNGALFLPGKMYGTDNELKVHCSSGVFVSSSNSQRPGSAAGSLAQNSPVLVDRPEACGACKARSAAQNKSPRGMNALVGELAEWQLL